MASLATPASPTQWWPASSWRSPPSPSCGWSWRTGARPSCSSWITSPRTTLTRALTVISCSTNVNIEDDIRCDDLCLQVQAPYSGRELYKAVWCFHNLFAYDSKHKTYDDKIHLSVIVIHRSGDAEECLNNIRQRERERQLRQIYLSHFIPSHYPDISANINNIICKPALS